MKCTSMFQVGSVRQDNPPECGKPASRLMTRSLGALCDDCFEELITNGVFTREYGEMAHPRSHEAESAALRSKLAELEAVIVTLRAECEVLKVQLRNT